MTSPVSFGCPSRRPGVRPPVPMEVANNQVIEQQNVNFDALLDMDEALDTNSKPSAPEEEENEEEQGEDREIFIAVEESPELIGGMAALQEAVEYPRMARKTGIEGRVIVQSSGASTGQSVARFPSESGSSPALQGRRAT